ncbi:MAG: OFA family MFS transporter [Eggerthellaceae bacterium]|nr:OFA family MFS transporter [Eggerthellaceae bacterium]
MSCKNKTMSKRKKESKTINRYIVLICCAVCGGLTGAIFMWSIFRNPLMEANGWDAGTVTFAYSFFEIMALVSCLMCGWLMRRVKASTLCAISGFGFALGWFLTGYAHEVWQLYLFFSVIAGFSDGFVYNACITVVQKWFPDKRGMAVGVCAGAMGLAPLLFAPLGTMFIETYDVFTAFKLCGIIFLVVRVVFGLGVKEAPDGYLPAGYTPSEEELVVKGTNVTTRDMFKQPVFYLLWVILLFGDVSGLMLTSQAAAIATNMVGLTAAQGTALVAIMAVASFSGRFGFGTLSDKIGRFQTLGIVMVMFIVAMGILFPRVNSFPMFIVAIVMVGFAYGSIMAIMPSIVSDVFGTKHFGMNWGIFFGAFTAASFIGPMAAATIETSTGSFVPAFYFAAALAVVGLALLPIAAKANKHFEQRKLSGEFSDSSEKAEAKAAA